MGDNALTKGWFYGLGLVEANNPKRLFMIECRKHWNTTDDKEDRHP